MKAFGIFLLLVSVTLVQCGIDRSLEEEWTKYKV